MSWPRTVITDISKAQAGELILYPSGGENILALIGKDIEKKYTYTFILSGERAKAAPLAHEVRYSQTSISYLDFDVYLDQSPQYIDINRNKYYAQPGTITDCGSKKLLCAAWMGTGGHISGVSYINLESGEVDFNPHIEEACIYGKWSIFLTKPCDVELENRPIFSFTMPHAVYSTP